MDARETCDSVGPCVAVSAGAVTGHTVLPHALLSTWCTLACFAARMRLVCTRVHGLVLREYLVRQWGHIGRYVNRLGVLSKELLRVACRRCLTSGCIGACALTVTLCAQVAKRRPKKTRRVKRVRRIRSRARATTTKRWGGSRLTRRGRSVLLITRDRSLLDQVW